MDIKIRSTMTITCIDKILENKMMIVTTNIYIMAQQLNIK